MAVLEQIPIQRITDEARQVHFGRTVLTVIAGLLFGLGWVTAKTLGGLWLALAWSVTAVRLGWVEARASTPRN